VENAGAVSFVSDAESRAYGEVTVERAAAAEKVIEAAVDRSLVPFAQDRGLARRMRASARQEDAFDPPSLARSTQSWMRPVHCPRFQTPFLLVPGSAYVLPRPRRPQGLAFFRQCARIALRRCNVAADDVILLGDEIRKANLANPAVLPPALQAMLGGLSALLATFLTVYPNAKPYIEDFVRDPKAGPGPAVDIAEDYKYVRGLGAGDCEDVDEESNLEFLQFCDLYRALTGALTAPGECGKDAETGFRSEEDCDEMRVLRTLVVFARLFVPCSSLFVVTNKKLDPSVGSVRSAGAMSDSDVLAHTVFVLVPAAQFWDACPSDLIRRTSRFFRTEYVRRGWHTHLQPIVCEGTSRMDSRVRPIADYLGGDAKLIRAAVAILEQRRAVLHRLHTVDDALGREPFVTEAFQDAHGPHGWPAKNPDLSEFYKVAISLYTPTFVDTRVLDFAYVYEDTRTYGVYFNDVVTQSPRLRILPYYRYTTREAALVDDVLLHLEPLPTLRIEDDPEPRPLEDLAPTVV
jgi:hypothetical protein